MLSRVERWMTAAKKILQSLTGADKRRRKKRQASPNKKVTDSYLIDLLAFYYFSKILRWHVANLIHKR